MNREISFVLVFISICNAQHYVEYVNDPPEGQCTFTFNVPSDNMMANCNGPEIRQMLEQIRSENKAMADKNVELQNRIEVIIKEYGGVVQTVKKLEQETASWRQSIQWPVFDDAIQEDSASALIAEDSTYDDCYQAVRRNNGKKGIYAIMPRDFAQHPHLVYCDEQGWTVIMRRLDGKVDFNRNWNEFSGGFGELGGEYFAGLEFLNILTSTRAYELHVELIGWNSKLYASSYDNFRIGNESDYYRLEIGNMTEGNLEGAFTELNGTQFTTTDQDHDGWSRNNCAYYYRGGWWLKNCGFDPSREWCNGGGCMSWGEHNAKKILLKIRPMSAKGSSVAVTEPKPTRKPTRKPKVPKPKPSRKPKKPKKPKKPRDKNKKKKPTKQPQEN